MLFGYPNNSTEVRNMDYLLQRVEELGQKVDKLMSDKLEEVIDEYFNKVMVDAIYDEETETIILSKEIAINDGLHIYTANDNKMIISDGSIPLGGDN